MEDQERETATTEAELKEDELELSLGLRPAPAIGRKFHLSKPRSPVSEGTGDLSLSVPIWGKGGAGSDLDSEGLGFEMEAKREAQALRRQEARKKREEKRKSKANALCGNSNGDDFSKRCRMGDQRNCASNGFEGAAPVPVPVPTSFLVREQGRVNGNQLNGLPYYMVMPGLVGGDGSALQPATVAAGGFLPYLVAARNSGDGSGRVDNAKHSVSGCSRGSSPGVSDHRSSSGQGGSSSDGGSHSSQSRLLPPTTPNGPTMANAKAEGSSLSCQIEPSQTLKTASNPVEVSTDSSNIKSCHIERNSSVQPETSPSKKPSLPTHTNEASVVNLCKPPKPPAQKRNEATLLSEMPYVSTTGNGPNGKTITGFLYKYTQSEVCIVCVCHGSFLTPAGFVEHAGGVDVDNPLRRITVVPFTFS